jgi:ATP-dependent DNA helicase RecQ
LPGVAGPGARRSGFRGRAGRVPHEPAACAPESWELFETLRRTRSGLAAEQGVKPRAVLPDRALMHMVRLRPRDARELAAVHGIGEVKLARYGEAFLEAVRAFESRGNMAA